MARPAWVRLLLLTGALILLIAPLSQALDRHDQYSARDAETNLCILAAVASAGFWAYRALTARTPASSAEAVPDLDERPVLAAALGCAPAICSDASPPLRLRI